MRPFVVDPAMHIRHLVLQPDFKVLPPREAEVFSDHGGKNYVEFLPRFSLPKLPSPGPGPAQVQAPGPAQAPAQFLDFRPREAKNMPLAEKVSAWLDNVPWIQVGGDWVSNCYPGHVSTSSRSSNANLHELKNSSTDQDFFEQQARQITRIITGNYLNNGETTARPITTVLDFSDQRYSDDGYLFDYAHVDMEIA